MSWDIDLQDALTNEVVEVVPHQEGGTIVVGGTSQAMLNITYNYSHFYHTHLDKGLGLKWLHKKRASDTIERLTTAITALGTERDGDYWASTPGNAGHALFVLLAWAKQHPDAIFRVS